MTSSRLTMQQRLAVDDYISRHPDGCICAQIVRDLGIPHSATVGYLRRLWEWGRVRRTREGPHRDNPNRNYTYYPLAESAKKGGVKNPETA